MTSPDVPAALPEFRRTFIGAQGAFCSRHGAMQYMSAIVTRGGSGFGFGIVEKFIQEGAQLVLILDVNVEGAGEKVAAATGSKFLRGDIVSQEADWRNALKTVLAEFGKLDIVINKSNSQRRTLRSMNESFESMSAKSTKAQNSLFRILWNREEGFL
jgi:NAD(P)-dependent dehydrogenase (short-subunit alcohol dehydrogenase family)